MNMNSQRSQDRWGFNYKTSLLNTGYAVGVKIEVASLALLIHLPVVDITVHAIGEFIHK